MKAKRTTTKETKDNETKEETREDATAPTKVEIFSLLCPSAPVSPVDSLREKGKKRKRKSFFTCVVVREEK